MCGTGHLKSRASEEVVGGGGGRGGGGVGGLQSRNQIFTW